MSHTGHILPRWPLHGGHFLTSRSLRRPLPGPCYFFLLLDLALVVVLIVADPVPGDGGGEHALGEGVADGERDIPDLEARRCRWARRCCSSQLLSSASYSSSPEEGVWPDLGGERGGAVAAISSESDDDHSSTSDDAG